jgi:hypothetical protein
MRKEATRRAFLSRAVKGTGLVVGFGAGLFVDLKFNASEGVGVAKERVQIGVSTAHATCGAGMNCSGGGGQCGAGMNCGGGGGQCGAGMNCSGGGGQCGAGMNCGGR